jgi:hypothetical protein
MELSTSVFPTWHQPSVLLKSGQRCSRRHHPPGYTQWYRSVPVVSYGTARIAARVTVTALSQPTILIIDDDAAIGRSLKRLSEQAFPGFQIIWVKNGVTGIELARQYGFHE